MSDKITSFPIIGDLATCPIERLKQYYTLHCRATDRVFKEQHEARLKYERMLDESAALWDELCRREEGE